MQPTGSMRTLRPYGSSTAQRLRVIISSHLCGKALFRFMMTMTDNFMAAAIAQMQFQAMTMPNDSSECRHLEHLILDYKEAIETGRLVCDVTVR